jgi:hypothetical protein
MAPHEPDEQEASRIRNFLRTNYEYLNWKWDARPLPRPGENVPQEGTIEGRVIFERRAQAEGVPHDASPAILYAAPRIGATPQGIAVTAIPVTIQNGKPQHTGGNTYTKPTQQDGTFSIPNVPAGLYILIADYEGQHWPNQKQPYGRPDGPVKVDVGKTFQYAIIPIEDPETRIDIKGRVVNEKSITDAGNPPTITAKDLCETKNKWGVKNAEVSAVWIPVTDATSKTPNDIIAAMATGLYPTFKPKDGKSDANGEFHLKQVPVYKDCVILITAKCATYEMGYHLTTPTNEYGRPDHYLQKSENEVVVPLKPKEGGTGTEPEIIVRRVGEDDIDHDQEVTASTNTNNLPFKIITRGSGKKVRVTVRIHALSKTADAVTKDQAAGLFDIKILQAIKKGTPDKELDLEEMFGAGHEYNKSSFEVFKIEMDIKEKPPTPYVAEGYCITMHAELLDETGKVLAKAEDHYNVHIKGAKPEVKELEFNELTKAMRKLANEEWEKASILRVARENAHEQLEYLQRVQAYTDQLISHLSTAVANHAYFTERKDLEAYLDALSSHVDSIKKRKGWGMYEKKAEDDKGRIRKWSEESRIRYWSKFEKHIESILRKEVEIEDKNLSEDPNPLAKLIRANALLDNAIAPKGFKPYRYASADDEKAVYEVCIELAKLVKEHEKDPLAAVREIENELENHKIALQAFDAFNKAIAAARKKIKNSAKSGKPSITEIAEDFMKEISPLIPRLEEYKLVLQKVYNSIEHLGGRTAAMIFLTPKEEEQRGRLQKFILTMANQYAAGTRPNMQEALIASLEEERRARETAKAGGAKA